MTQFERRLQNANSYNSILLMMPRKKDNLSEEDIISLKAQYLGTSIHSVKFNVEKMRLFKCPLYKRMLKKLFYFRKIIINKK
ncbi:hypothetical protein D3C72_2010300 [compost metagenome]